MLSKNTIKLIKISFFTILLTIINSSLFAQSGKYYLVDNNPWGQTNNDDALNTVFGTNAWTRSTYSATLASTIFSASNSFVMIEGGDGNTGFPAYMLANQSLIETWVSNGGYLLIKSAPNYGATIPIGFSSTNITYPSFANTVSLTTEGINTIGAGPSIPMATTFTGSAFAHATISGTGYTNLITSNDNNTNGLSVLSYKNWGAGKIVISTMTDPIYISPKPESQNLLNNIIKFASLPPVTLSISSPIASLTSCFGASSIPTTFNVTGSNLTASVTITVPPKFEISTSSGGTYSSSLILTNASTVSQTLYVRMNTSATEGANSGTISVTSTGASDVTTTVSGTVKALPTLSVSSIVLCAEATYLITKTTSMPVDNGWSVSGTITVNNGYVTAGTSAGSYTVSYIDGCAQTVSATVTVGNSDISPAITGLTSYKISNTNPLPQGPTASLYIGYNGTNYYSATKPTNTGFYKANNQSGNTAGCPYPFYIFRCTTCPD
jgi:hypothetical protein